MRDEEQGHLRAKKRRKRRMMKRGGGEEVEEEEKEEEKKKKEEAKEKAVERTQAIRNSLSKLRSKFDQIRK